MTPLSFPEFALLWQRWQGQATPAVHRRILRWLAARLMEGEQRLLLLAFRNCGKSTLLGLLAAWLLYRHPDHRVLVLAAEQALATKLSRYARQVVERHPLCAPLRGKGAGLWTDEAFTVARTATWRDPSLLARGIGGNITGAHADTVICDDVEVPNTAATAARRAWLRERLGEIEHIVSPDGLQIYAGTPHTYYSIYADAPRAEMGEDAPFLAGYRRCTVPILARDGSSAWPERFPPDAVAAMRARIGPSAFASQMLLQPEAPDAARLDPDRMRAYDADLVLTVRNGRSELSLGDTRLVAASGWWDPAFGQGERGDGSVFAVVFSDADGGLWLHRVAYLRVDPADPLDPAGQQCRQVAELAADLYLPGLTIETNGIGAFLPGLLRRELARRRLGVSVQSATARQAKDTRILAALEVPLAARLLRVHRSVLETPFPREMREWRPGRNQRDDGLDAVAGAIAAAPVRLPVHAMAGQTAPWWGHGPVQAPSDFSL
ncbi:MAG: phage terminase large subunit [Alphaproteobacteria bacterium]|nr:phage terminase large subunit [Alphaproteobacteria bacterium]MCB9928883.1 phage terminase large subunit [Alphaproteobacteria bacterium]